jgi:RNA polymerase sigma-70 factor (ECF subfamily)
MDRDTDQIQSERFIEDLIRMQDQLYFYALQLTEDSENARDLVQETSYKALKNRQKLHDYGHIRAWLYTILRNTHINYLRSGHRRQTVSESEEYSNTTPSLIGSNNETPETFLIRKEVHETLDKLPLDFERPIHLFLSGHSYKEIAREMKIPIGTVKSRIHLGKKRIRKYYTA